MQRAIFRADSPDDFPRLSRIFEMAKRDFWNESEVIDWDRPLGLPDALRAPLARILSVVYYGERAALEVSAQLLSMVPDEQCKLALATQVVEEAKHVSVFRRLLERVDRIYPAGFWSRRLLGDLIDNRHPVAKMIGMQLIVENFANTLFKELGRAIPDPHVREVLSYVERDEAKHLGMAAIYLPSRLALLPAWELPYVKAKQAYWSICLERVAFAHREDAATLGIVLDEAMRRCIESQHRLVAGMPTRRGVWRSSVLERIGLARLGREMDRLRRAPSATADGTRRAPRPSTSSR